jgi:hypothetical protein
MATASARGVHWQPRTERRVIAEVVDTGGPNDVGTHATRSAALIESLSGINVLLVGAAGLEPATTCLEGRCSIHLSYAPA